MTNIIVDAEKRQRIENLIKEFKSIDAAMLPFREHRNDLRKSYLENDWLTKEEYNMVKKAYNMLKNKVDVDELASMMDIAKVEME